MSKGQPNKPIFSRTAKAFALAFGRGGHALVQILILAALSRWLTKADYGTFQQTLLIYTLAAPLLSLGIPAGLLYFIPKFPNRTRGILTESMVALLTLGIAFGIFLLLGGADLFASLFDNADLSVTLRWFAFYPLLALPVLAFQPVMVATDRVIWVTVHTIVSQLLRTVIVLGPMLVLARTPLLAIQMYVLFSACLFLPTVVLMYKAANAGTATPEWPSFVSQMKYCLPLAMSTFLGTINKGMDKTIVASMFDKETFAVFVNGAMEIPFIILITGSAAAILMPELARLYDEKNFHQAMELFRRSATKCGAILIPIAGFLFIVAPELMVALYGQEYRESSTVFRIYLLILPFRIVNYGILFQAAGRPDLVLSRAAINLVLNLTLTIVLAHWFGPIGAAIGTVVSMLGFVFPYCILTSAKLYDVSFLQVLPFRDMSILVLISLAGIAIGMALSSLIEQGEFLESALSALIYSVIVGSILLYLGYFKFLRSSLKFR